MTKSKIEWTDKTWNPVSGCTKVSEGCRNCYAETYAHRFWGERKFSEVLCHEGRLEDPLHWKKPRKVFVNSMSDLFHEEVPYRFVDKVFNIMARCPHHTFQVLTKRPSLMLEFFNGAQARNPEWLDRCRLFGGHLPNVWLGVSVEDQKSANMRIPFLLHTPAAVRFISYEPALGPVDFTEIPNMRTNETVLSPECWGECDCDSLYGFDPGCRRHGGDGNLKRKIDWIIMGGESGPNARPMDPDWARSVLGQCLTADVPFFFKQWGEWLPKCQDPHGIQYSMAHATKKSRNEKIFHQKWQWLTNDDGPRGEYVKTGKTKAGRLLDNCLWSQYPRLTDEG